MVSDLHLDPQLEELEAQRARLYEELAGVGDVRRGSISENYRRCGKPNCACAQPDHPGHGPRYLWTRSVPGRGTRGRQLSAGEVGKVRRELAGYDRFAALSQRIVEVNEAICEARPAVAPAAASSPQSGDERGALRQARAELEARLQAEITTEVTRLAAVLAGQVAAAVNDGGGQGGAGGLETVELAIRTAMLALGGSLLGRLLAADTPTTWPSPGSTRPVTLPARNVGAGRSGRPA